MSFHGNSLEIFNPNLVCLRLNELNNFHPMVFLTFSDIPNILCKNCGLFLSSMFKQEDEITNWMCPCCHSVTTASSPLKKIKYHDVLYQNMQSSRTRWDDQNNTRTYVFCIDISGSMQGAKMQLAKAACLKMIDELVKNYPDSKVVVNMFNSGGFTLEYYRANGTYSFSRKNTTTFVKRQQFESNNFNKASIAALASQVPTVRDSYECVKSMIASLKADGGTSISEALTYSTLLAAELKNCSIILCSDGEIDERKQRDKTQIFFDKVINYANENSTRIYTLRLDTCCLQDFENLSRKTGGKLANLDQTHHTDFNWIIDDIKLDAEINKYESVSIMSSRRDIGLKCLYQADILNQSTTSNRIDLQPFMLNSPKELYIELEQTGQDSNVPFFVQLQLKSSSFIRVISLPLELKSNAKSKFCFSKKPPYDFRDGFHNREIIHLNAWRYLSYMLLEKKSSNLAKRYLDENRENLNVMVVKDESIRKSLNNLLNNLSAYSNSAADLNMKIDDESTMFLSNILTDTNQVVIDDIFLAEDHHYICNPLIKWDGFQQERESSFQNTQDPFSFSNFMPPMFGNMFGSGNLSSSESPFSSSQFANFGQTSSSDSEANPGMSFPPFMSGNQMFPGFSFGPK